MSPTRCCGPCSDTSKSHPPLPWQPRPRRRPRRCAPWPRSWRHGKPAPGSTPGATPPLGTPGSWASSPGGGTSPATSSSSSPRRSRPTPAPTTATPPEPHEPPGRGSPLPRFPSRAPTHNPLTSKETQTMSHHIDKHGEQAAAIFARTDPWHRLGVTVAGRAFTAQEAMTLGRLGGWDVHKVPLTAHELHQRRCHRPGRSRVRDRADQPVHRAPASPGRRRRRVPAHPERGALRVPQPPGRRLRGRVRHRRLPARRASGVRHHDHARAPPRRRDRPARPQHRRPEQPRRLQRVPAAADPGTGRVRQHPGRGPAQPRRHRQHPAHHGRTGQPSPPPATPSA